MPTQDLKSYPNYYFFFHMNVILLLCFVNIVIIKTENRRPNNKTYTENLTAKLQNSNQKIFSWVTPVASSGSEQTGRNLYVCPIILLTYRPHI